MMSTLDAVYQNFRRSLSHFIQRNVDGRKHGRKVLGHVDIINTDDGYIAGNGMTGFLQSPHDTDGSDVIGAEISSGVTALF